MDQAGFGRDNGVEENREIGPRHGIGIEGRSRCRKMTAGGHAHDADLGDAPFAGMVPAVTECVLDVGQRDLGMTGRHAVADDSDGIALAGKKPGGVGPFAAEHQFIVAAARADQDHLPVPDPGIGKIDNDPRTVGDGVETSVPLPVKLGRIGLVGLPGAQRNRHAAFDNPAVGMLAVRVEVYDEAGLRHALRRRRGDADEQEKEQNAGKLPNHIFHSN